MKLTRTQFDHYADMFKTAAAIIFGGLVIGSVLSERASFIIIFVGTAMCVGFILVFSNVKEER